MTNRIILPDTHQDGDLFMKANNLGFEISQSEIDAATERLRNFYQSESGETYSEPFVRDCLKTWLELRFDALLEDFEEMLTAPGRSEAHGFRAILKAAVDKSHTASQSIALHPLRATVSTSVFNGFRQFSAEKLGAMTAYFAEHGKDIYKTKLNKLLFYADFVNFYKFEQGISGAAYLRLPYGPVPDNVEEILKECEAAGTIRIEKKAGQEKNTFLIRKSKNTSKVKDNLTPNEIETLDWVLENYGELTTAEIVDLSHREKAYRFTRPSEEIAYEYAKFFEKLPEKPKRNK